MMDCFYCSDEASRAAAVGVCVDCGCAACGRHGAVEAVAASVRTGNMFEERPMSARRFRCAACRNLSAARGDAQRGRARAGVAAG